MPTMQPNVVPRRPYNLVRVSRNQINKAAVRFGGWLAGWLERRTTHSSPIRDFPLGGLSEIYWPTVRPGGTFEYPESEVISEVVQIKAVPLLAEEVEVIPFTIYHILCVACLCERVSRMCPDGPRPHRLCKYGQCL